MKEDEVDRVVRSVPFLLIAYTRVDWLIPVAVDYSPESDSLEVPHDHERPCSVVGGTNELWNIGDSNGRGVRPSELH